MEEHTMDITEDQKKRLFTMAKDICIRRDMMLSLYDQSKSRKQKEHFLSLSITHAASEHGIHSCFKTLGLLKEYSDFTGECMEDFSDLLFCDAYIAEKCFLISKNSYYNAAHPDDRAKKRQECRERLAVYKGYLRVFSILDIMGKYQAYKEH